MDPNGTTEKMCPGALLSKSDGVNRVDNVRDEYSRCPALIINRAELGTVQNRTRTNSGALLAPPHPMMPVEVDYVR